MARDFNGSTDRIDYATGIPDPSAQAQTWSFWANMDSVAINQWFFTLHVSGDTSFSIVVWTSNVATGQLEFFVRRTSTHLYRRTNGGLLSTGADQHILITWDGSENYTGIRMYLNGSEMAYYAGQDGTGSPYAAIGSWSIGGQIPDDTKNVNTRVANVGWWNKVQPQSVIDALAAGASPRKFPGGLKFAPPLIRHQRDPISGAAGTLDGTSVTAHPRTIFPRRRSSLIRGVAAAAPTAFMTPNKGYW